MTDSPPRLLAFAGSLRQGSYNRRLVRVLAEGARAAGAQVTLIELRDYPLPVYDGDIEADGMPAPVRELQALMANHDGLLISTPEYNGSMPALRRPRVRPLWISCCLLAEVPRANALEGRLRLRLKGEERPRAFRGRAGERFRPAEVRRANRPAPALGAGPAPRRVGGELRWRPNGSSSCLWGEGAQPQEENSP